MEFHLFQPCYSWLLVQKCLYFHETGPSTGPWNRPGEDTASESRIPDSASQQAARDTSSGSTLRRRPRQFGGNVHSLRSDDQGPSDDRNVYWNGNSTEFGGEDKK